MTNSLTSENETQRLSALYALNILDTPPEERFDRITRLVKDLFHVSAALITFIDTERQWFKSCQGITVTEILRTDSFCNHTIMADTTFVVPNTLLHKEFSTYPLVAQEPHIRFYAGHPITAPDGSRVGTLCILDTEPRQFSPQDKARLKDLTAWVESELNLVEINKLQNRLAELNQTLKIEVAKHQRAQRALIKQRDFLQQIIDINPHFIFAKDRQGRFVMANLAFANAYRTTVKELIGKTDADFHPNKEMTEKYTRDDMSVLETGREIDIPEEEVINVVGERLWRHTIKRPIVDEKGEIHQVLGVITDITDRKQAEEALAQARDQALEASRLKSQLLAKVSHELRTPLNAILGFAEMLEFGLYGSLSNTQQKETVSEIIDSTHYLTTLVNELLDQAQLESGKLKLNIAPFAPANLLDDVQSTMGILAQNKGLKLTTQINGNVPKSLPGDYARLQQILVNLVSNAVKFTMQGQVDVRLYCPNGNYWALQVTDTGPGIPAEAQKHIFEPFQQVDGSVTRQHRGTGLGLSIVKQLADLMGGHITLTSREGQGSTFTVSLPLQPAQEKSL